MLERAISAEGLRPSEIDHERMASLLTGRIYRELRDTVPKATLQRELERLARSLRQHEARPPSDAAPEDAPSETQTNHDQKSGDGTGAEAPADWSAADVPDGAAADGAAADGAEATSDPAAADDRIGPADVRTPAADVPYAAPVAAATGRLPDDHEVVLMALAILDGVDGVAVFDAVGHTVSTRGEVSDAGSLGRVIAAAGNLLERHGVLRSVNVKTSGGALVAVPVPPHWVAVSGAPDLNLGAVYAALSALEEER